jgi:hypothetical protein
MAKTRKMPVIWLKLIMLIEHGAPLVLTRREVTAYLHTISTQVVYERAILPWRTKGKLGLTFRGHIIKLKRGSHGK